MEVINLLSSDTQKQLRAAHLNLRLRNYTLLLSAALIGVAAIFGGGYFLTLNDRKLAEEQLRSNEQRTAEYAHVRQQAEEYAADLKIAKSILSQEVLYSDMIIAIAKTLPENSVLEALTLDRQTLQKPVALSARVKNENSPIDLKLALERSPIFEDVSINNVTTENVSPEEKNQTKKALPVTVQLTVTFTKGQPGSLLP